MSRVATPHERRERRQSAWLFVLFAMVMGAGIGLREPWPADEPRFALAAHQMIESGDWSVPHRGQEIYAEKPPLFMWSQAAAYTLVGNWRIAFLLPSLLAALSTLALVYDLARRLYSRRTAQLTAGLLASTVHFGWVMRGAQIDPLVTFWIALGTYAFARDALVTRDARLLALGWFAAGLGIITKGVGVVALLMLLPIAWARLRGWRGLAPGQFQPRRELEPSPQPLPPGGRGLSRWLAPFALLLAFAIWPLPLLVRSAMQPTPELAAYLNEILLHQTRDRYANAWHHHQPFWYYAKVIALNWMPFALLLPWAVPAWWRRFKRLDARVFVPLAWIALVLVFFTLSSGKREVYILPALPMACLAMAPLLAGLWRRRSVQRTLFIAATAIAALLALIGAATLLGHPRLEARLADYGPPALAWVPLSIGALALVAAVWLRPHRGAWLWALTFALAWTVYGLVGYPLLDQARSARGVMQHAGTMIGPQAELGLVAWKEQNLLQADRRVTEFGFKRPAAAQRAAARAWQLARPDARWLLIDAEDLGGCIDPARTRLAGNANRREWRLLRADAWRPACTEPTR
ncbi:MAG: glycosyltransferase family 39 protein [Lysobacterales bacterium]